VSRELVVVDDQHMKAVEFARASAAHIIFGTGSGQGAMKRRCAYPGRGRASSRWSRLSVTRGASHSVDSDRIAIFYRSYR
jgi:hypothetical protein